MKERILKLTAALLTLCLLLPLVACGKTQSDTPGETTTPVTADVIFEALKNGVAFDAELTDRSSSAETSYAGMPENVTITMYGTNARYADELTWFVFTDKSLKDSVKENIVKHIEQKTEHYQNYQSDQLDKLGDYVLWEDDLNVILCITSDADNARAIIQNPSKVAPKETKPAATNPTDPTEPTSGDSSAPTEPQPTETAPASDPTKELNAEGYPAIISQDQSMRDCGNACIVDNMAYEYYGYSSYTAQNYASLVSKVSTSLAGQTDVYSLIIPTAIGVVFPDNLVEKYSSSYERQGQRIAQIFGMMDSSVIPVNCYENLMNHRDEYLYFRTDWHWTGTGAYYAYETFCQVKGVSPYTMEQRRCSVFDNYLGALYWNTCNKDAALSATPDTVYAYHPYSENAYMYLTDFNGDRYGWPIISDVSNSYSSAKYYTFAGSDQPFAEFYNPDVTDGSVAIVVKESFGNVLMSYLVDHYSTVYEIDYRYWEGDLVEFARQVGADDIIFANNIGMIRSDYLVGLLDNIIP